MTDSADVPVLAGKLCRRTCAQCGTNGLGKLSAQELGEPHTIGEFSKGAARSHGERIRTVILVAAVREVHANDVETIVAELVDGLDRVGLGANGADNRGTAELASRLELSVELGEPLDLASKVEVVKRSSGHCEGLCVVLRELEDVCRGEDWRSARY